MQQAFNLERCYNKMISRPVYKDRLQLCFSAKFILWKRA